MTPARLTFCSVTALALVAGLHALNLVSPLRLNNDAIRLLELGWQHAHPAGVANQDQYPPGYPLLLATLFRGGLVSAIWIHLLSFVLLAAGLADWWRLLRRELGWSVPAAAAAQLAVLLNWIVIKHLPFALSDIPYLALVLFSVNAAVRCWRRTDAAAVAWGLAALGTAAVALAVRTVGITLLGTCGLVLLFHPLLRARVREEWSRGVARRLAWTAALVVLLAGVASGVYRSAWYDQQFRRPGSYFQSLRSSTAARPWTETLKATVIQRGVEITETTLNLPTSQLPVPRKAVALAGMVLLAFYAHAAWRRLERFFPVIVYLLANAALMLVWAYYDSRFMLPLIPALVMIAGERLRDLSWTPARVAVGAGAFAYAVLGCAALGYSVRLTFSGDAFPRRYGGGSLANEYAVARGEPPSGKPLDARVVTLLQRHDAARNAP